MKFYGLANKITKVNVYRKTGTIVGTDTPVEAYTQQISRMPVLIEPMSAREPFVDTLEVTHRIHTEYRTDLRIEDRFVELNDYDEETTTRYTIKHIREYIAHHLEIYCGLDSQPLV